MNDVLIFDPTVSTDVVTTSEHDVLIFDSPREPITLVYDTGDSVLVITGGRGPTGPIGPQGPEGGVYTHTQVTPSASWLVIHGFNRYVSVDVYVDNLVGLADIEYIDPNTLAITFPQATVGVAAVR